MKSNKQRRHEIIDERQRKQAKRRQQEADAKQITKPHGALPVHKGLLATFFSYGEPHFIHRGWYEDIDFICQDCGMQDTWTARQQKWWFEERKGSVWSHAVRCKACRLAKRIRDGRAPKQK